MTDEPAVLEKSFRLSLGKIRIFFSILLMLILLGGFGYGYLENARMKVQLAQLVGVQQKRDVTSEQAIAELQKTVNAMQLSMQKSQSEWQAASEIKYLITMANDQLQFTHNINMTMQLLQQADKALQSSNDAHSLELRKALALDLANLEAKPKVDVTSIYLRLNALNDLMDKLPLPMQPLMADHSQSAGKMNETSAWKSMVNSTVQGLSKIVIVRKNDASALPIIMPDEKIFLYQNLHAELASASWGLLHENAVVYTESLARTIAWIEQYFVQDAQETKSILQQLTELQKMNVQPAAMTLTSYSMI